MAQDIKETVSSGFFPTGIPQPPVHCDSEGLNSSAEGGFHYSLESSNRNPLQFTGTRKSITSDYNRESPSKMSEAFKMPTEETPKAAEGAL